MFKKIIYVYILLFFIRLNTVFCTDTTASFLGFSEPTDAYLLGLSGSDLIPENNASLLNNPSAGFFLGRGLNIGGSFYDQRLMDVFNGSVYAGYTLGPGMLGVKALYYYFGETGIIDFASGDLYSSFLGGLSYSIVLNQFISRLPFIFSGGLGISYARETIYHEVDSAVLFDGSITLGFLNRRLWVAGTAKNFGYSLKNQSLPLEFEGGFKILMPSLKVADTSLSLRYSNSQLYYHTVSAGCNVVLLKRFSFRLGGKTDPYSMSIRSISDLLAYNNAVSFGLGVKLKLLEIDLSVVPFSDLSDKYCGTVRMVF